MKLVRYGLIGKEKPGLIDKDGNLRDLSSKVIDINEKTISSTGLKKISSLNIDRLPRVKGKKRYGVPIKLFVLDLITWTMRKKQVLQYQKSQ